MTQIAVFAGAMLLIQFVALAQPIPDSLILIPIASPNSRTTVRLTNSGSTALTAIAYASDSKNTTEYRNDFEIRQGWKGLEPGQSLIQGFGRGLENPKIAAAVFADGRVYGDPESLEKIFSRRRNYLAGLDAVIHYISEMKSKELRDRAMIDLLSSGGPNQDWDVADRDVKNAVFNINLFLKRQIPNYRTPKSQEGNTSPVMPVVESILMGWRTDLANAKPPLR